jgi:hypothetical protein
MPLSLAAASIVVSDTSIITKEPGSPLSTPVPLTTPATAQKAPRLVLSESQRGGAVNNSVYWLFCKAASWRRLAILALCLAVQQGCMVLMRYWLKWWGEASEGKQFDRSFKDNRYSGTRVMGR